MSKIKLIISHFTHNETLSLLWFFQSHPRLYKSFLMFSHLLLALTHYYVLKILPPDCFRLSLSIFCLSLPRSDHQLLDLSSSLLKTIFLFRYFPFFKRKKYCKILFPQHLIISIREDFHIHSKFLNYVLIPSTLKIAFC